jgi:hypothetical protein
MADSKISALPASTTPLAGTEVLPIVQSSTTKQVSVANLTAGRDIAATSLTTAAVQATNSGGLTLKNSSGTTQLSVGAGGGDNITLSVATNITPANAAVAISPTGTGTVAISPAGALTINPTAASTINNVSVGATTAASGGFTTIKGAAVYQTSGYENATYTLSTPALVYSCDKDQGANLGSTKTTFNITGVPNTDGSFAFIRARASNSAPAINCEVTIQVHGTEVFNGYVQNATKTAVFVVFRQNGAWVAGAVATGASITAFP